MSKTVWNQHPRLDFGGHEKVQKNVEVNSIFVFFSSTYWPVVLVFFDSFRPWFSDRNEIADCAHCAKTIGLSAPDIKFLMSEISLAHFHKCY